MDLLSLHQRLYERTDGRIGRRRSPATARIVTADDAAYPRLWKLVNERNFGRYDRYQAKTTRRIPLVVVTATA